MNPRYGFQPGSTHPAVAGANHREQELAPTATPDLVHPTALCGEWAFFLAIHVGFGKDGQNVCFQPSALSNQQVLSPAGTLKDLRTLWDCPFPIGCLSFLDFKSDLLLRCIRWSHKLTNGFEDSCNLLIMLFHAFFKLCKPASQLSMR